MDRYGFAVVLIVSGCAQVDDTQPNQASRVPHELIACVPNNGVYDTVGTAYYAASSTVTALGPSIRRLNDVAAGFRQVLVARALLAQGVSGVDQSMLLSVARIAAVNLTAQPDGTFKLPEGGGAFTVRVWQPQTDQPVAFDVLSFDSYFEGARLVSDIEPGKLDIGQTVS